MNNEEIRHSMGVIYRRNSSKELIKSHIVSSALGYIQRYKLSSFDGLSQAAGASYGYLKNRNATDRSKNDYKEQIFDFVLGDNEALTNREYEYLTLYYSGSKKNYIITEETIEQFRQGISCHRAEIKRLTEATASDRSLVNKCRYLFDILNRLNDYINYFSKVEGIHNDRLFLASLYYLGYIDGKKAE